MHVKLLQPLADSGRNPIGRRTQSNRAANEIRSGGGRNPIGRRSVHDGNHKAFTLPPHPLHR